MSRPKSRRPPARRSSRPKSDPVASAIEVVAEVVGRLEKKLDKLIKTVDANQAVVVDRLKKLEKSSKAVDRSLGGLAAVVKTNNELLVHYHEGVVTDLGKLKERLGKLETKAESDAERRGAAGKVESL